MIALHGLCWNFLFSHQMICKQCIILNHVFLRYEGIESVTLMLPFCSGLLFMRRLCFYRCLSFILFTGGCVHGFIRGGCMVLFMGGMRGFIWGACMVLFRGACVVLFGGRVWFYFGGHAWFYSGGMVLFGGHVWFYSGGMCGFIQGGVCGFIRGAWFYLGGHAWFYSGACVVLFRSVCVVLFGGMCMHGFIWGACVVLFGGGHAWFFQFFRIQ